MCPWVVVVSLGRFRDVHVRGDLVMNAVVVHARMLKVIVLMHMVVAMVVVVGVIISHQRDDMKRKKTENDGFHLLIFGQKSKSGPSKNCDKPPWYHLPITER